MKKSKIFGFLVGLALVGGLVWGGATFSRIKTWVSGETLTASDLNAEFNNILNNLTPAGVDDYSSSVSEMRSTADPYPGAAESQATALSGEIERLRYQVLQIKKAVQTGQTYWYEDLPTEGVFTIAGSSVGINDTTPSASLDITGSLSVSGDVNFNSAFVVAYASATQSGDGISPFLMKFGTETRDYLNEYNASTFTATNAGNYYVSVSARVLATSGSNQLYDIRIYVNGVEWKRQSWSYTASTSAPSLHIEDVLVLSANDTVSIWGGISLGAAEVSSGDRETSLIIRKMN